MKLSIITFIPNNNNNINNTSTTQGEDPVVSTGSGHFSTATPLRRKHSKKNLKMISYRTEIKSMHASNNPFDGSTDMSHHFNHLNFSSPHAATTATTVSTSRPFPPTTQRRKQTNRRIPYEGNQTSNEVQCGEGDGTPSCSHGVRRGIQKRPHQHAHSRNTHYTIGSQCHPSIHLEGSRMREESTPHIPFENQNRHLHVSTTLCVSPQNDDHSSNMESNKSFTSCTSNNPSSNYPSSCLFTTMSGSSSVTTVVATSPPSLSFQSNAIPENTFAIPCKTQNHTTSKNSPIHNRKIIRTSISIHELLNTPSHECC
ncbi:hypothetical protein FDP41_004270 [Naegleria fowleri]|uniref:Uncharacterized protein n=1 Tax=Naegleria fowleri TaxID=5763 RepID=A0A6A5BUH2_NAEFO|nr:uncharacterized protein FDP41_004270 [Naegleria fowleri]KAF0976975.1 hypothetical protein FDP41_004270 [Naegleria fowleri]